MLHFRSYRDIQKEHKAWVKKNFPNTTVYDMFEGMVEELGELAHARLKRRQGIRGTKEEHDAEEKDAIGDIAITAIHYATLRGFDVQTCVNELLEDGWVDLHKSSTGAFIALVGQMNDFSKAVDIRPTLEESWLVGDLFLTLRSYCSRRDLDFTSILNETWDHVKKRDWTKNPLSADKEAEVSS